jgi:hypothetical protein
MAGALPAPAKWNATQEDADAVLDVLLTAANESQHWKSEPGMVDGEEAGEDEATSATDSATATPQPPRSDHLRSLAGRKSEATGNFAPLSAASGSALKVAPSFNRLLTRSMDKRALHASLSLCASLSFV